MRRTGPTNIYTRKLIDLLKKKYRKCGAKIWKITADLLEYPRRKRIEVNVGKISRIYDNLKIKPKILVVPGVVLGHGDIKNPVIVAALKFTKKAKEKIESSGGRCLSLYDAVEINPDGSNTIILR
ncbi:MAG: 50S ribosomal protein L18e [Candidatus Methanomethylicia archaeon]